MLALLFLSTFVLCSHSSWLRVQKTRCSDRRSSSMRFFWRAQFARTLSALSLSSAAAFLRAAAVASCLSGVSVSFSLLFPEKSKVLRPGLAQLHRRPKAGFLVDELNSGPVICFSKSTESDSIEASARFTGMIACADPGALERLLQNDQRSYFNEFVSQVLLERAMKIESLIPGQGTRERRLVGTARGTPPTSL